MRFPHPRHIIGLHGRLVTSQRFKRCFPVIRRRRCWRSAIHRRERNLVGGLQLHGVSPKTARLQFGGVAVQDLVLDAAIPSFAVEVSIGRAFDVLAVLVEEAADAPDLECDVPAFLADYFRLADVLGCSILGELLWVFSEAHIEADCVAFGFHLTVFFRNALAKDAAIKVAAYDLCSKCLCHCNKYLRVDNMGRSSRPI